MFLTLRARLLLTYGLIIVVMLSVVSGSALLILLRSPLLYRQTTLQLQKADQAILTKENLKVPTDRSALETVLNQIDQSLGVRVAVFQNNGIQVADSRATTASPLRLAAPRLAILSETNDVVLVRDQTGLAWFAIVQRITPEYLMVMALRRPRLAVLEIFSNELLRPLIWGGLVGLLLAILISIGVSNWITFPLRRITKAAHSVAAGRYKTISLEGPDEVKELASSFNRMTRRVQDSQQSQREFVANVSHELKTPLTSIQGFSQAILDGAVQTPEELRQAVTVIYTESNRMNRLVMDLLSLARLEAGTADLQSIPIHLNTLLQSIVEKFTPQARQANIQLRTNMDDLPQITGDEDRLAQVFSNIIDNALKFTPDGGQVTLSTFVKEEMVWVKVADTGVGVPPEERERIFERLYQVDRSRPGGKGRGLGLGLAIARQIVLAHDGNISVEENQPQGSIFVVKLPVTNS